MTLPDLPAMRTDPKFIFFTDFDGTITLQDSNDYMTDNLGFGSAKRKELNEQVLANTLPFRDAFWAMMDSVKEPFDYCLKYLLEHVRLDPGFSAFVEYAKKQNIPVVVLSGGMFPVVDLLLKHLVGDAATDIQIVSNDVGPKNGKDINTQDGWEITFHDDSGFGHDKSLAIRPYAQLPPSERPIMFYAGDGVSDLSAARETDLLFAKKGKDLVMYCVREDAPFTEFHDWDDITAQVKDIVEGKISVKDAAATGYSRFKDEQRRSKVGLQPERSGHTTPVVPESGSKPMR